MVKVGSRQKALEEYTQCERAMRKIRRIEERVGGELEKKDKKGEKSTKLWKNTRIAIEEKDCSRLLQYEYRILKDFFYFEQSSPCKISDTSRRHKQFLTVKFIHLKSPHPKLISQSSLKSLKAEGNPLILLIEPYPTSLPRCTLARETALPLRKFVYDGDQSVKWPILLLVGSRKRGWFAAQPLFQPRYFSGAADKWAAIATWYSGGGSARATTF